MTSSQNLKRWGRNEEKSERFRINWFLYFSGSTVTLLFITIGSIMVWTSPVIPKLLSNDTSINPLGTPATTTQISLLASLPKASGFISFILVPKMVDIIGRKKMLTLVAAGLVFSLGLVAFSKHIYVYYGSVLLKGVALSGVTALAPIYINEIAENANRGRLGCMVGMGVPIGIVLGYIFGSFASIKMYSLLISLPSVLYLILSYFIPETPIFFALRNRKSDGLESLGKLRNVAKVADIESEYDQIEQAIEENRKLKKNGIFELVVDRAGRRASFIIASLFIIQQFSGIGVILGFMAPIFNEVGSNLSGNSIGIIVSVIQIISCSFSVYFVDKLGRRPLILYSTFFCGFPMFILGLYFYLKSTNYGVIHSITWLPVLCVVLFIIAYSLGLGPVVFPLIGELFSNELRAVGGSVTFIIDSLLSFFLNFTFPFASQNLGVHWCLWFFSCVSFLGYGVMYFVLPETKNKSFAEIQSILKNKRVF